ncbi:hypothetical protein PR048_000865 [Dryococelus australis]|uniref:Uncharacterized protein n=1 Tax=Dryococelus australis TaxID=614101 RepID=A0ABQ9IFV7_9NEOP|nr:hypothetical protein PR048_000865 [Dryococelus australis]
MCSRKVGKPTNSDITSLKRVWKYFKGTSDLGIRFAGDTSTELFAYCDSNFARDKQTRRSTTGYVIFYCGRPISWSTRKQPVVVLSTTEADYIAPAE